MLTQITRALLQAKRYPALVRHVQAHGESALFEGWRELIDGWDDPSSVGHAWFMLVVAAAALDRGGEPERIVRCFTITDYSRGLYLRWSRWYAETGLEPPTDTRRRIGLEVPLAALLAPNRHASVHPHATV